MKNEIKKRENKNKNEYKTRWFKEDLPSLIESDEKQSLSHESRMWALKFANPEDIGTYYWSKEFGVKLQNVGDYRVRCIMAFDTPDSRIGLAMLSKSFNAVGVKFELGEYTVVVPFAREQVAPSEAEDVSSAPGMEVI